MTDVTIPHEIWEGDEEGVISTWLAQDGEAVAAGDILAEIMNEKTAFELVAPVSGILTIQVVAEIPVRKGQVVATIR